jgi:hypothetical protein
MPLFAMIVMGWAFTTYNQIHWSAVLVLIVMQFIVFVMGWRCGKCDERNKAEVRKEAVV